MFAVHQWFCDQKNSPLLLLNAAYSKSLSPSIGSHQTKDVQIVLLASSNPTQKQSLLFLLDVGQRFLQYDIVPCVAQAHALDQRCLVSLFNAYMAKNPPPARYRPEFPLVCYCPMLAQSHESPQMSSQPFQSLPGRSPFFFCKIQARVSSSMLLSYVQHWLM